ncbi:MAG: TonB-dependent receptor family protein [Candidatus Loosdrechtia sp.]|uniref:TonB-dependent receptor family protein n=1 Tax=Candidatus Loosdrechtia sp. TaxID=3101272 RepID=UPI003A686B8E|nr:MAG: TonB-dependent receptor [Candidatus Jettenia sp. AMX2]
MLVFKNYWLGIAITFIILSFKTDTYTGLAADNQKVQQNGVGERTGKKDGDVSEKDESEITAVEKVKEVQLKEVLVEGTHLRSPLAVQPTTNIPSRDLEIRTPRSLEEVLQAVPGIQARSRGGDDVRLSLRGSGLQSVVFTKARGADVLIDGFPVNSADGNFDYGLLSPVMAESVQVYHGGEASALGSLTLGGAINLSSPTGRTVVNRIRLDGGSFGYVRGVVSAGFLEGNWDGVAQVEVRREDGFRDFSDNDAQKAAMNIGYAISENVQNRLYLNLARVHQNVSLPITQAELESNPSQGRVNGPPGNFNMNSLNKPFYETLTARIADRLTIVVSPDVFLEVELHYLFRDVDSRRQSLPVPLPLAFLRGPGWLEAKSHDFGGQLRFTQTGTLAGNENRFVGGVRIAGMWGTEKLFPNLQTVKGDKFADGDLFASNVVLYLEDEYDVTDRLTFLGGLRAFYSRRDYDDNFNTGAGDLSKNQNFSGIAPRIGARWKLNNTVKLFGTFSHNPEPPAFGDIIAIPVRNSAPQTITIQDLNTQKANVLETGVECFTDTFRWRATVYYSWLKDEIIRFSPEPGIATVGNQVGVNADKTRHYGFEMGFDWTFWQGVERFKNRSDSLRLLGQYTLREHRFHKDSTFGNNKLAGVPTQLLYTELLYENASGFYAGPNVSGIPASFPIDNANTFNANSFVLLGARAGWRGKNWSVFFEGRNLTDEAYVAASQNEIDAGGTDQSVFFPGEGRSFYGGAEWRW